jgi:hypothetical protein
LQVQAREEALFDFPKGRLLPLRRQLQVCALKSENKKGVYTQKAFIQNKLFFFT